jgi:hypothetical protein
MSIDAKLVAIDPMLVCAATPIIKHTVAADAETRVHTTRHCIAPAYRRLRCACDQLKARAEPGPDR